jgi:DNA-binding NarL/FixJ family response regulator
VENSASNLHSYAHPFFAGPPAGRDVPPELAGRAELADAHSTTPVDLQLVWKSLVSGALRISTCFFSTTRCGIVMTEPAATGAVLSGRRREILERILCGTGQYCVALELHVAPSTVALNARLALEGLGVAGRPSRAHPLLMRAAAAARERQSSSASLSFIPDADCRQLRVIGIPRPDDVLARTGAMPAAELEVIRHLVEGRSYAEIAALRGTAERTIANQIATAFKRMNVSGRNELIPRLFELERRLLADGTRLNGHAGRSFSPPPLELV